MNFSYDYEDLLKLIKDDLDEGRLKKSNKIRIVRGEEVIQGYYPIKHYYYFDYIPQEPFEVVFVSDVIDEMEYYDKIFK